MDLDPKLGTQFESDVSNALDAALAETPVDSPTDTLPVEASAEVDTSTPDPVPETIPASSGPRDAQDDDLVTIIVDGQPQRMTLGEARKGFMMHSAFTKKTMAVAKEREEAQTARARADAELYKAQEYQAQLSRMLQDPNKLAALYMNATGQGTQPPEHAAPAAPAIDPQQLRQQLLTSLMPEVNQHVTQYLASQAERAAVETDVTSYTNGLLADDPVLSAFGPDLAEVIYGKVAAMRPTVASEAKEFIRLQVEDYKTRLGAVTGQALKASAVAKAKAATATERGGSPVTTPAKEYTNFNAMQGDIEAWLTTHSGS